jgi:hypothetical protein
MKIFFYPLLVIFCLISCNSDRREYAKKVMAMDKRMIEYIDEYYSFRSDLKKGNISKGKYENHRKKAVLINQDMEMILLSRYTEPYITEHFKEMNEAIFLELAMKWEDPNYMENENVHKIVSPVYLNYKLSISDKIKSLIE